MSIIAGSEATGGTGALATTVSITGYAVPAGNNKRLLVAFCAFSTNTTFPVISSVTHNGVAMTQVAVSQSNNANGGNAGQSNVFLYELVLGSTTPTGDIVATFTTNFRCAIYAVTLQDVAQTGSPTLGTSQSLGPDSATSTTSNDVLDFAANGAQGVAGSNTTLTIGSGQTSRSNRRLQSGAAVEFSFAISSANSPGASSTSMQWTGTTSLGPRAQHIVASYAPAATAVDASITATMPSFTAAISVDPAVGATTAATLPAFTAAAAVDPVGAASVSATMPAFALAAQISPVGAAVDATVAATMPAFSVAAQVDPVAFSDVPYGGAAWLKPRIIPRKKTPAEVLAERVPDVGHIPPLPPQKAPEPEKNTPLPEMDTARALKDATAKARALAKEQAANRRAEQLRAKVARMEAEAQAKAAAAAKAAADEEDDWEALLFMAW